jgi:dipeptidyl aminopeptidase/acylaminoacyl peptidase
MKRWRAVAGVLGIFLAQPGPASAADASPSPARQWTIKDLVEVRRITSIAVRDCDHSVAFIVKSPDLASGEVRFEAYLKQPGAKARLLARAQYLADLAARPFRQQWTLRADLGDGVQLYSLDEKGKFALLKRAETGAVGGFGLVYGPDDKARPTGILSYQWSPDGAELWYSRLRLRSKRDQQSLADRGIVYDDDVMTGSPEADAKRGTTLLGTELRLFDPAASLDRLIAFVPAGPAGDFDLFRTGTGSAAWAGKDRIQFRSRETANGVLEHFLWSADVRTAETTRLPFRDLRTVYYSVPTPAGLLTVEGSGEKARLIEYDRSGAKLRDFGKIRFDRVGGGLKLWFSLDQSQFIAGVEYPDRDGLAGHGLSTGEKGLSSKANLSECAFTSDLSFGACSEESLERPPRLLGLWPGSGRTEALFSPNPALDSIPPLRTERRTWTNSFGATATGFVTYPRNYRPGTSYPALVISHGGDAKNRFADPHFQWEYPLQVLAERGYFILSVNEPARNSDLWVGMAAAATTGIGRQQFFEGHNPLATMEAAAQSLINSGDADPKRIGIAGYSRGSTVARFAISHSTVFSAASSADSNWYDAGGFWAGGKFARSVYTNLFGGSPFDPHAAEQYRQFSPSARPEKFAGPLLQQFAAGDAKDAIELDQMLRHAGVPTELIFFPDESHIFWHPRHRAAAMEQNVDWFDYWLQGRMDPAVGKAEQYRRWTALRDIWQRRSKLRETDFESKPIITFANEGAGK